MGWKKLNQRVIIPVLILALMAAVFYFGGNAPGSQGWSADAPPISPENLKVSDEQSPHIARDSGSSERSQSEDADFPKEGSEPAQGKNSEAGKSKYHTDPVPEGKPQPVEPQDVKVVATTYTCTISISCGSILDNLDLCDPEKVELVPQDGWILKATKVTFNEGESAFDVLQRICKQQKIHMEFMNTPIYNSAYIEGIQNLYEFDVGELSGWMYKVNDWFPNYGSSRYKLQEGDVIEWVYSCDLGVDVGGDYAAGKQ